MALALVIAATSKSCASDETNPAAESPPTTTAATPSAGQDSASGQAVITQINTALKSGAGLKFVTGKSDLAPESSAVLDKVATILQKNATVKADVRGYTDNQGDPTKNIQLSEARAQAVVAYFVSKKGITADRLTATGFGAANPVATNDTETGRAQNRRVEFVLGG
jgi:OOP family OmpA-OmpF porin